MNFAGSAKLARLFSFKPSAARTASFFVRFRPEIPAPSARIASMSSAKPAESKFFRWSLLRFNVTEKTSTAVSSEPEKAALSLL